MRNDIEHFIAFPHVFFEYDEWDSIIAFDRKEHDRFVMQVEFTEEEQALSDFYCSLIEQLEGALKTKR